MSLLDRITRHQVYLEGFKIGTIAAFNPYLRSIEEGIRKELAVVKVSSLDDLTKAALAKFINLLRGILNKAFNKYVRGILAFLRRFMRGEVDMFASILEGSDKPDTDALWASIRNAPLPGNGQFIEHMLQGFAAAAEVKIVDTVHKAYANGSTVPETLAALVGNNTELFGSSIVARLGTQNVSIIETIIQHIASLVETAVAKSTFSEYTWVSIVDKGTTDICRNRDGNVYKYGDGPLPPAHYKCRSATVPGRVEDRPATFYSWLKTQPPELVKDMLGAKIEAALSQGRMKAADFAGFRNTAPLTLDDFLGKLDMILT